MSDFIVKNGVLEKYNGNDETIIIPNDVTDIGPSAFANCSSLKSVSIPDGVTNIGYKAFGNCSSLESITIPKTVKSVCRVAFKNCNALKEVHITDIAAWCEIIFEKESCILGDYDSNPLFHAHDLYLNGELVRSLVIPDDVISIGNAAFICCSLTSITIPDSVTNIGESAFEKCEYLAHVEIPNSIENLDKIFFGCPALFSYYIFKEDVVTKKYSFGIPNRIKDLHDRARVNYTITYHCDDSACDDGDNGMGYDYDNSYTIHREPLINEIVIKDDNLYGFAINSYNILKISKAQTIQQTTYQSPRYNQGSTWSLTFNPCIARYMWVPGMKAASSSHKFFPEDFPEGLVKSVVKQMGIEDKYGHFDGEFDVTVELTDSAVADPDGTLAKFKKFNFNHACILLKKP